VHSQRRDRYHRSTFRRRARWIKQQEEFSLTDVGDMSIHVANITGAPNLARQVIANASGTLREFAAVDQNAQGTGSLFAGLFQSVAANSTGDLLDDAAGGRTVEVRNIPGQVIRGSCKDARL